MIGGLRLLTITGLVLNAKEGWSYQPGILMAESVLGLDRRHGETGKPTDAFLEGPISITKNLKLKDLFAINEAEIGPTVVAESRDGTHRYIIRNARWATEGGVGIDAGELACKFIGDGDIDE